MLSGAVLVVDDEAPIRGLLAAMLSRHGFATLTAASADEALAVARSRRLGLVICDYGLGEKNGLALLSALRAEQPEVPFVLVSALFPPDVPELAHRAGCALVLEKSDLLADVAGHVRKAA